MDFNIDFSMIDFIELRERGITREEIVSILNNRSSYFEIEILQVDLPYEKDIKQNWCGFS